MRLWANVSWLLLPHYGTVFFQNLGQPFKSLSRANYSTGVLKVEVAFDCRKVLGSCNYVTVDLIFFFTFYFCFAFYSCQVPGEVWILMVNQKHK